MVKANLADKPKRPMSAYFLWMNGEGRADVKKKNPAAQRSNSLNLPYIYPYWPYFPIG
mgnify:CR=1 FL=1